MTTPRTIFSRRPAVAAALATLGNYASDGKLGQPVHMSQKALLTLRPSDVYEPEELSTFMAGYRPAAMRADEASPVVLVDKEEGSFRTLSADDAFEQVAVKADADADVPEVDLRSIVAAYSCTDRMLGMFLPQRVVQQASFDVMAAGLRRLREALDHDREIDVWTMLTTTGNWNADNVLALGATQNWNGGSDSDPLRDLHIAIEASKMPPTAIWMNQRIANAFMRHDRVRDHVRSMVGDNALGAAVGSINSEDTTDFELPGLPKIRVSKRKYKNSAGDIVYAMADKVVLTRSSASADGSDISTSTTFRYEGQSRTGFDARAFEDPSRGARGGTTLVAVVSDVAYMTADDVGGLISGVYT